MSRYKFRGKAIDNYEEHGIKRGDWVYGYLYIDEKTGEIYILTGSIRIKEDPDYWEYSYGYPPSAEDFYIDGMIEVDPKTVGQLVKIPVWIFDPITKAYEGDVLFGKVRKGDGYETYGDWMEYYVVIGEQGKLTFFRKGDPSEQFTIDLCVPGKYPSICTYYWYDFKGFKVIGSIYDNPEILKGGE